MGMIVPARCPSFFPAVAIAPRPSIPFCFKNLSTFSNPGIFLRFSNISSPICFAFFAIGSIIGLRGSKTFWNRAFLARSPNAAAPFLNLSPCIAAHFVALSFNALVAATVLFHAVFPALLSLLNCSRAPLPRLPNPCPTIDNPFLPKS